MNNESERVNYDSDKDKYSELFKRIKELEEENKLNKKF